MKFELVLVDFVNEILEDLRKENICIEINNNNNGKKYIQFNTIKDIIQLAQKIPWLISIEYNDNNPPLIEFTIWC